MTEIGKSNIIKAQLIPIVSFTGTLIELPEKMEKDLATLIFNFLWGGRTDKITRALSHQERQDGGLGIPHLRARLESYKATWVSKLGKGNTKPWTMCFNIGPDWNQDGILDTLLPLPSEDSYAAQCIKAWNGIIGLLEPPNNDTNISQFLPDHIRKNIRRKASKLTFGNVKDRQFDNCNLNFLEKNSIISSLGKAEETWEKTISNQRHSFTDYLFNKTSSRLKWPKGKTIPGSAVDVRRIANQEKYNGVLPSSFTKLRQIYQLFLSRLVPRMNPFRSTIEATLGTNIEWKNIDQKKLFIDSKHQSFFFRSTHGLLYTNKDYYRFDVKSDSKCSCGEEQNLEHIMLKCQRYKILYANFERQFSLAEKLTDIEKLMGIDPSIRRSVGIYKKLNIMRRAIIQYNYRDESLRWNMVLNQIDQCYVVEYSIADKRDRMPAHFKAWDI